jgi:cell division protein FtsW (lipid II flippase)
MGSRHDAGLVRLLEGAQKRAAVASMGQALRVVFFCQVVFACLAGLSALPIEERPLPYVSYSRTAMTVLTHCLTEVHLRSEMHKNNEPQVQRRERYDR